MNNKSIKITMIQMMILIQKFKIFMQTKQNKFNNQKNKNKILKKKKLKVIKLVKSRFIKNKKKDKNLLN